MLRRPNFRSLRGRLFLALFLSAAIPTAVLLLGGSLLLREVVMGTGSAGPWDAVANSGQALLSALEAESLAQGELARLAAEHREQLSASVRLSRLYAFLGERTLALLPPVAFGFFLLGIGISLWSAKQLSKTFVRPVRELVEWTETVGRGEPLPPPNPVEEAQEIREMQGLRAALRGLERDLARGRARELQEARNRSWSEMARRVAHDLKNPLAPMRMAARTAAGSSDPVAAEAGKVLGEEIDRLDTLARSLAQFGRPSEGPTSAVDLRELLTLLVRRTDPAQRLVALTLPTEESYVKRHPDALERALRNLLANALEATPEDRLPVELILSGREAELWTLEVLDRGSGLPEGEEGRIWEPDFTTKRRGTGLGLPLVRQVFEAHGGSVQVHRRPGGGTEFWVQLPKIPAPEERG